MRCLLLLLALSFSFNAPVYADDNVILRPVNQTLEGDNFLSILPLIGVGPEFRGRSISYVVLKGRSENGKGMAAVSVDGTDVTAFQSVGSESRTYTFTLPGSANRIGENTEDFQFHLRGTFTVEAVGVKFIKGDGIRPGPTNPRPTPTPPPAPRPVPPPPRPVPQPGPAPQPAPRPIPQPQPQPMPGPSDLHESLDLRQYFQNGSAIQLSQYIDLRAYAGYRLRNVTVYAMSRYGSGQISFCGRRGCSTVPVAGTVAPYGLAGGDESVDDSARLWRFVFQGDFWVEKIELDFVN